MKNDIYWIDGPWTGRVAIVPRPRGGEWLEDEARAWRDAGIDTIVSLLEEHEVSELDLGSESTACRENNIEFLSYPIMDRSVPESFTTTETFFGQLEKRLTDGKNVAVHCRQGLGRSALIIASVMVLSGVETMKAFELISQARRARVPETAEQRVWVEKFARRLHAASAAKVV